MFLAGQYVSVYSFPLHIHFKVRTISQTGRSDVDEGEETCRRDFPTVPITATPQRTPTPQKIYIGN